MLPLLLTSSLLNTFTSLLLLYPVQGDINTNQQFPDPIENLIPTYGEDLVPGYSQQNVASQLAPQAAAASQLAPQAAAAAPVMSGIDMLRMAVPGTPGEDYPIYASIPATNFDCEGRIEGGYYADTEADCQPFHICTADGSGKLSKYSFLCPNGTLFNQEYFVCEYWFNVDCSKTESFYSLNEGIGDTSTGAASSPVKEVAAPSEPEDESFFKSSPVAEEPAEEEAANAASPAGGYDAPDSAASAPLSSYEPQLDSYGSPEADAAPVSSYSPPPPVRTGRKKKPNRPQPKGQGNRNRPANKPRGGRTQFKKPSSKLPIVAPVFRKPSFPQFKAPKPFLTPIRPNRVQNPVQKPRGGRNKNINTAPAPAPAPKPQTGYGAPPPLPAPANDNYENTPAPTYNEPSVEITTPAPAPAPAPAAAPVKDYSFFLSSPQGVEPPPEYEYEEEPLPTYKGSGSGDSNYLAPVVEEEPAVQAIPAESPTYESVSNNLDSDYFDDDPLPTYNRDAIGTSGSSYNAPGSEGLYGAPPAASEGLYGAPPAAPEASYSQPQQTAVQTGYGAPPPPALAPAPVPQVDNSYEANSEPVDDDPLPTYTGGVYKPTSVEPSVPQTGYGAPPPLPASNPVIEYDPPVVDDTIELEDEPLATYIPNQISSNNVDSYTAPGAIDSYGAPTPAQESFAVPTASVSNYGAPESYGAPPAASSIDSYAIPAAPAINSYDTPADPPPFESYGSPAAPSQESYGPPAAPAQDSYGPPAAPAQESYGPPAAPTQDTYESPAAPTIDSYESPAAPTIDSYESPAAPALDSYGPPAAPALDSYGPPAAPPLDSYDSPAAPALGSYGLPPNVDILPEYYKSEITLGLANPNEFPRIEPFLADYGKEKPRGPIRRPPPPPPPKASRPPRRKPAPAPSQGYGVPAAPPLGLPSYKSPRNSRGGFKRSLFRGYGR